MAREFVSCPGAHFVESVHVSATSACDSGMIRNSSIRARIAQALSAQVALRAVVIGQQIFLTPLFLSAWGIEGYATWIAASAVASFASLASVGLGQATSAAVVIKIRENDQEGINALFSNSFSVLVSFSAVWLLISACVIAIWPSVGSEHTAAGGQHDQVIFLMNVVILLGFLGSPFAALWGAAVGAGGPTSLNVFSKVFETLACAAVLYFLKASQLSVALIMASFALLLFVGLVLLAKLRFPGLRFRTSLLRWSALATLTIPSLNNFLLFLSANILAIQVPRLIILSVWDAAALSLFAAMTTYFRTIRSFCVIVPAAIQIEVSLAFGGKETERLQRLLGFGIHSALWMSMIGGGIAILIGPYVFPVWTHNLIPFDWKLAAILLVGVLITTVFDTIAGVLVAVNALGSVPLAYCGAVLVAMLLPLFVGNGMGLYTYCAILVLPEVIGLVAAVRRVQGASDIAIAWWSIVKEPPWSEAGRFIRTMRGQQRSEASSSDPSAKPAIIETSVRRTL